MNILAIETPRGYAMLAVEATSQARLHCRAGLIAERNILKVIGYSD